MGNSDAFPVRFSAKAGWRITDLHGADVEFSMIMSRRNWRTGIATEAGNALLYDADRIDGDEIHALVPGQQRRRATHAQARLSQPRGCAPPSEA